MPQTGIGLGLFVESAKPKVASMRGCGLWIWLCTTQLIEDGICASQEASDQDTNAREMSTELHYAAGMAVGRTF